MYANCIYISRKESKAARFSEKSPRWTEPGQHLYDERGKFFAALAATYAKSRVAILARAQPDQPLSLCVCVCECVCVYARRGEAHENWWEGGLLQEELSRAVARDTARNPVWNWHRTRHDEKRVTLHLLILCSCTFREKSSWDWRGARGWRGAGGGGGGNVFWIREKGNRAKNEGKKGRV